MAPTDKQLNEESPRWVVWGLSYVWEDVVSVDKQEDFCLTDPVI